MTEWLGHFQSAALYGLAPLLAFSTLNWAIAVVLARLAKVDAKGAQLFGLSFGAIGIAVGLLLGASRDGAVAAVVPALLTFLSGFAVYQFGKNAYAKWRPVLPIALICLVVGTLCGAAFGGSQRNAYNESVRRYDEWRFNYENLEIPLRKQQLESKLFPDAKKAEQKN